MSSDDRDFEEQEPDQSYEEPARSIFSALWFRVVLVVIVVGIIGALAVPYVLEWVNPQPAKTTVLRPTPPTTKPPAPSVAGPAPAPAPTAPVMAAPVAPSAPAAVPSPAASPSPAAARPAAPSAPAPPRVAKEEMPEKTEKTVERPKAAKGRRAAKPAVAKAPVAGGAWFVQVGAFHEPERARKLAASLRERKFSVDQPSATTGPAERGGKAAAPVPAPGGAAGDTYDVFVTGGSAADIGAKLSAKGLAVEKSGSGVVVKPSLPLRDAVALSKDLAVEGFKVQVRRAASGAPAAAAAAPAARTGDGEGIYRVRVGPYADRAAAQAALAELEAKGYKGFITRGGG